MPHKNPESCQALHFVAAVASLHEVMNSHGTSPPDTQRKETFLRQREQVLHSRNICLLPALYAVSLALILLHSFCNEKYITRQAAQEILFRLVIAQTAQREGKESEREREVFFWLISQRSRLARFRNLWVWLRVERHRMKHGQLWLCHNMCLTEISAEALTTRGQFSFSRHSFSCCAFF